MMMMIVGKGNDEHQCKNDETRHIHSQQYTSLSSQGQGRHINSRFPSRGLATAHGSPPLPYALPPHPFSLVRPPFCRQTHHLRGM
jgi:hypothetical protein